MPTIVFIEDDRLIVEPVVLALGELDFTVLTAFDGRSGVELALNQSCDLIILDILLLGFGAVTLVAGQQVSARARQDYEERLQSEAALIAQTVARSVNSSLNGRLSDSDLDAVFAQYESQISADLTLLQAESPHGSDGDNRGGRQGGGPETPEIDSAMHGGSSIDDDSAAY